MDGLELQSFDVIANHELSRRIDYLDGVVHALTFGAEVAGKFGRFTTGDQLIVVFLDARLRVDAGVVRIVDGSPGPGARV